MSTRCGRGLGVAATRLLLGGALALAMPPGLAAEALPRVTLTLGPQPAGDGLRLTTENADSNATPLTRAGRAAVTGVALAGAHESYLYFTITAAALKDGRMPFQAVTVEYFDEGTATLSLQYDSSDQAVAFPNEATGAFKLGSAIRLTDTKTWKTAVLAITDAQFSGRCHGGDFRLATPVGTPLVLGAVAVAATRPAFMGALPELRWRVVKTAYPTTEPVVAGYTVTEFGARGDGITDDTLAFQWALTTLAKAGGGTLFVPAGRYAIRGNLVVPTRVTLRGDWAAPQAGRSVAGTVLMAYAGRDTPDAEPFLGLSYCSGVRDLAIWYPEQRAEAITPYPACIRNQGGGGSYTIKNVTLVNPYRGIQFGPGFNELFYVRGVYGSPLDTGLEIADISDIGRAEDIHFNPDIWSASALPGAPAPDGPHRTYMYDRGTGFRLFRVDWTYAVFLDIRGYATGMETLESATGAANGMLYGCTFTGCQTAVRLISTHEAGFGFTACVLDGEVGIDLPKTFPATLYAHSTTIRGTTAAARLDGLTSSTTLFRDCAFTGAVIRSTGNASLSGCSFAGSEIPLLLESGVNAATIVGSTYGGAGRPLNRSTSKRIVISDEAVPPTQLKPFAYPGVPVRAPGKETLYVVTDPAFGARKDGTTDDTAAIQAALDTAGRNGGGTVFLPGGDYAVRGQLTVPAAVELRGCFDVPHHSIGKGSVLRLYAGRGDEHGTPAIALRERSGVRGLTLHYPEQTNGSEVPYPPTLQGQGAGIYIIDTTGVNPYIMVDLASQRCDNHYLDYVAGAPLRVGIRVGAGARGGEVRNAMFNPHYWLRIDKLPEIVPSFIFATTYLEAFVFGDCENQLQFQNFNYAARIGLHFISENGRGANGLVLGHGTDGSLSGVVFDGAGSDLTLVNTQCDVVSRVEGYDTACFATGKQFGAAVTLYNTSYWWGDPKYSVLAESGTLRFELGHFNKYGSHRAAGGHLQLAGVYLDQNVTGEPEFLFANGGTIQTRACLLAGQRAVGGTLDTRFDATYEDVIVVAPDATEIAVILSNPPQKAGLRLLEQGLGELAGPVTRGGREGWAELRMANDPIYYMSLAIDLPGFKNGKAPQVEISIDYFDEGRGEVHVRYDSNDPTCLVVPSNPGAWKEAGQFALTGTQTWKTFTCTVADAKFASRCNGNDLRLEIVGSTVPPVLGAVRLRKR